jgi:hypothetical protein
MLWGGSQCRGWQEEHAMERRSELLLVSRESVGDVLLELSPGGGFRTAPRCRAAPCLSLLGLVQLQGLSLGAGVLCDPKPLHDRAALVSLGLRHVRETVRHVLRQAWKRCELHCIIYRADDLLWSLASRLQTKLFHEPCFLHAMRRHSQRHFLADRLPP